MAYFCYFLLNDLFFPCIKIIYTVFFHLMIPENVETCQIFYQFSLNFVNVFKKSFCHFFYSLIIFFTKNNAFKSAVKKKQESLFRVLLTNYTWHSYFFFILGCPSAGRCSIPKRCVDFLNVFIGQDLLSFSLKVLLFESSPCRHFSAHFNPELLFAVVM